MGSLIAILSSDGIKEWKVYLEAFHDRAVLTDDQ
jgi:hypothetical protein